MEKLSSIHQNHHKAAGARGVWHPCCPRRLHSERAKGARCPRCSCRLLVVGSKGSAPSAQFPLCLRRRREGGAGCAVHSADVPRE